MIEVLVVVAIIALLIAILLPSLSLAREQAQRVVCLANMSNMPKAAISFSMEHKGYLQLIGREDEWTVIDKGRTKYAYQAGCFSATTAQLKAWPVAYAPQLGMQSLKRNEQCFDTTFNTEASYYLQKFGRRDIFICPSDKVLVNNVWSPFDMFGVISYAANEDVMGVTNPEVPGVNDPEDGEGRPWNNGVQEGGRRLEGRMDRIIRPSEVVLFCDGGNEDISGEPALLISNGPMNGPYLENYERVHGRLPHFRHGKKGGVASAFADGSGQYLKPLEWISISGKMFVKRYGPRARVSPYEVGQLRATQP
ncbi:MAG: hypothetical protein QUV05_03535 [Phycisphaerae bacterium]|nr:hypothetical protein [Phycisphaerae bacterium]